MKNTITFSVLAISLLTLINCSGSEDNNSSNITTNINTTGARSGIFTTFKTSNFDRKRIVKRPSYSLGPYISIYLSQNQIVNVISALKGINVQIKLARSDSKGNDETYALLEDYGTVLQVNIVDMLNRSNRRDQTLEKYLNTLRSMNKRMNQKKDELEQKNDFIEGIRRERRKKVSDVERTIRNALKNKNYSIAGPKQEELTKLQKKLAEVESRKKQIKDKLDIVKDLLKVGEERLEAIEKNKDVLIAGLKVTDTAGLKELGIFIKN